MIAHAFRSSGIFLQKNEEDPKKKSTQRKRKSIAPKKNQKGEGDESNWAHKKNQRKTGLAGLSQSLRDDGRKRAKINCLPKGPFQKLVREIAYEMEENLRFQKQALDALLDASEAMLVNVFEDANLCTLHAGRVTLFPSDMKLARTLANHSVLQQI